MNDTYIQRNRGFITSHKLQEFMRCQFCYAQKFINELPNPYEEDERKEAFLIGQAFDDLMTFPDKFKEMYAVVSRRLGKSGDKIELTNTQGELLEQMRKEFMLNDCFDKEPKKKVLECRIEDLNLRCELDNIDDKAQMFRDMKTSKNIVGFEPEMYIWQMAFYQLIHEELTNERYGAILEVVDKNKVISRSAAFMFAPQTLFSARGRILNALAKLKEAQATGIWLPAREQMELYNCPYYGYKGHGRPKAPFIF